MSASASLFKSGGNKGSVNPIFRMLFLYMTMKAWFNYTTRKLERIRAAQELGHDYVDSESDQDDQIDSEESGSGSGSDEFDEDDDDENGSGSDGDLENIEEEGEDDDRLIQAVIAASKRNIDERIDEKEEENFGNSESSNNSLMKHTIDYDNQQQNKNQLKSISGQHTNVGRVDTGVGRTDQTEEDEERKALIDHEHSNSMRRKGTENAIVKVASSTEQLSEVTP